MRLRETTAFRLSGLALAATLSFACAGPQVREQTDVLKKQLDKARTSGAKRCAPRELAIAETNYAFALVELEQGNAGRAEEHVTVASTAVTKAIDNSKECERKVFITHAHAAVVVKPKDTDGDGITDNVDQCPNDPEDFDKFEDEDGCPEKDNDKDGLDDVLDKCPNDPGPPANQGCPVHDKDGDGIPDDIDRCPIDPEDKDGFQDEDGCPDPDNDRDTVLDINDKCPMDPGPPANQGCPVLDQDGDGIKDDVDRCPKDPEDKDGFEDTDGCPDPDNDQDDIPDIADKCPNEPGIPETYGCPPKDRDGDGVPDHLDKCPDEEGVIEEQGCPRKYTLVVLKKEKIEIKEQVHFATNKYKILEDSFGLLDQIAMVLKDHSKIKVRIEGHTDSQADDDFNMKLSQNRADAVRDYLIKAGISPDRLVAVGFGETVPIASNATDKGKAANRRVEFNITER